MKKYYQQMKSLLQLKSKRSSSGRTSGDFHKSCVPEIDTTRKMVRITQYSDILMNAKKLFLTINAVDFQGNSDLLVKKNVNLQTQID